MSSPVGGHGLRDAAAGAGTWAASPSPGAGAWPARSTLSVADIAGAQPRRLVRAALNVPQVKLTNRLLHGWADFAAWGQAGILPSTRQPHAFLGTLLP